MPRTAVTLSLGLALFLPAASSAASPPVHLRLTRSAIVRLLSQAREAGTPKEHLALMGPVVTVSDGAGGTLTAVLAVRVPTADGYGQYVLFWHDGRLVGSQNRTPLPSLGPEAISLAIARARPDAITVRFARYRKSDPMCCPSLPAGEVTYSWRDERLEASGPVPSGSSTGLSMRLPRARAETPRILWAYLPKGALSEGVGASLGVTGVPRGWRLVRLQFLGGRGLVISETPAAAAVRTYPRSRGGFSMGADGRVITFLFPYPPGPWAHRRVRFAFVFAAGRVLHRVLSAPFPFPKAG